MPTFLRASLLSVSLWCAASAHAQWVDDPAVNTPVVQSSGDQDVIKLAVAPDASSWVGWFDFQPGGIEVRVQRLDAGGNATFPAAGLLVSDHPQDTFVVDWDLRADAAGNCMLTFVDIRAGGDFDVYAYLIAPDGTFLWGPDGVAVSDNAEFEADPRIIQNTLGDYLVVWPRFDVDPGLYVQRIDASGAIQLPAGGVRFYSDGAEEPAFVEVIPTTLGEFVCSWVRDTSSFLSDRHVMAGRYDADGVFSEEWREPLVISDATSVPIAHRPRLIPDPIDDAIIVWHDTRDGDFDCYVQMVETGGSVRWVPGGLAASLEPARQQLDPAVAIDPITSDIMIVFRNTDSIQDMQGLRIQRFARGSGLRLLTDSGAAVTTFNDEYDAPPRLVACLGGVAALCEIQPFSGVGNFDGVLALHRIQSDGSLIDAGGALGVGTTLSAKGRLSLAPAPGGAVIAAWTDDRAGDGDVLAQRINEDGSLGPPLCIADLAEPFGQLDFSDVVAFLSAFVAMEEAADLAAPTGVFDFSDVITFLLAFDAGCP